MKKVFQRFAIKSLAANRTRTLVTIIGITLSMALFTAVIEGAYSGWIYMRNVVIEENGRWEGVFLNQSEEQRKSILQENEIRESAGLRQIGWAESQSTNIYKPYLLIQSYEDGFVDLAGVNVLEGRLPENDREILLPRHLKTNGGVDMKVGEELVLDVGIRVQRSESGEYVPAAANVPFDEAVEESVTDTVQKTYTVTGIYSRLDTYLEDLGCSGYYALTANAEPVGCESGNGSFLTVFTVKHMRGIYQYLSSQSISEETKTNTSLLMLYGIGQDFLDGIIGFVIGLVIILVLIIVLGSVTLIYNSFSISVSERTRQFGMLKSTGATKKQIRSVVLSEALILSGAGIILGVIIGCGGIGITLGLLSETFSRVFYPEGTARIHLVLNPAMLLTAALICLLSVLLAAWIPAGRAMRLSVMDALRQKKDLKVIPRKLRTPKWVAGLFGLEGMVALKNFKRNRKGARSVIISLALSLILFISATAFTAYIRKSSSAFTADDQGYDIRVLIQDSERSFPEIGKMIRDVSGVNESAYTVYKMQGVWIDKENIIPSDLLYSTLLWQEQEGGGSAEIETFITFVEDDVFIRLADGIGQDPNEYMHESAPKCLAYDLFSFARMTETGKWKYYTLDVLENHSGIPVTIYQSSQKEGYVFSRIERSADGTEHAIYSHMVGKSANEGGLGQISFDYEEELPFEETVSKVGIKIGAFLPKTEYYMQSGGLMLIFPYSMLDTVCAGNEDDMGKAICVKSVSHARTAEKIKDLLSDENIKGSVADFAEEKETTRLIVMVIDIFSYGFIILISLIALANVFNTISTNIILRRREFAIYKSIGLSEKGFRKMTNYECVIYGIRGLAWGLSLGILISFLIFRVTNMAYETSFFIPPFSIVIAVGSVFAVVFAAMWYSAGKIRKDNLIDALKNEIQ